jgi:hypothetical protein
LKLLIDLSVVAEDNEVEIQRYEFQINLRFGLELGKSIKKLFVDQIDEFCTLAFAVKFGDRFNN